MNMNCGIHDAYALAAAVRRVYRGAAIDDELDAYAETRRRVAAEQLLPMSDGAVSREAGRLGEMTTLARDPAKARAYLVAASLLDSAPPRTGAAARC
jgi:3-(3-hydroxy-phenyl)propionate hydroxylase